MLGEPGNGEAQNVNGWYERCGYCTYPSLQLSRKLCSPVLPGHYSRLDHRKKQQTPCKPERHPPLLATVCCKQDGVDQFGLLWSF